MTNPSPRRRCIPLIFAMLCVGAAASAHSSTMRYSVLSNGEKMGAIDVVRNGDRVEVDYSWSYNGRGPKIHESIELGAQGRPIDWRITGHSNVGAAVEETYRWSRGTATWHSRNFSGSAPAETIPMYVAAEASPFSYGLYLHSLLAQKGQVAAAVLPNGSLHAESIGTARLPGGGREIRVFALWGLGSSPHIVLMDARGEFFGFVDPGFMVIVPEAQQAEAGFVVQIAQQRAQQYLEQFTKRVTHHFDVPVYIRNVRVFDTHNATVGEPTTVVIFRDRISSIRPDATPPAEAVSIDAEGGTLLPGLTDMHTHLRDWVLPLQLAGGVTSVRDMGSVNEELLTLMRNVASGRILGPRITPSGFIEGRSPYSAYNGFVVDSVSAGLDGVRWYADHGYPAIKLYSSIAPDWVAPLAAEAHRLGMRVSGHIPAFMTSEQAVRAGYDEINHINLLLLSFVLSPTEDTRTALRLKALGERMAALDLTAAPVKRLIELMQERHTALDPTMSTFEQILLSRPGLASPGVEAWLSHMPGMWQRANRRSIIDVSPEMANTYQASWDKLVAALKLLYDSGIRLLPGTDNPWGAGFALHTELEIYAAAGIPPARVLQLATLDCARYLGRDQDLGSIERGKLADLALVAGDPTRQIGDIRRIRMVVKNGDIYLPQEIYSAMSIEPFASEPAWRLPAH